MSKAGSKSLFYLVAGEASGDKHGAELLRELKKTYPHAAFAGAGGRHLKAAGQDQLFDLAEHAVVGLTDVLLHYFKFKKFFNLILDDLKEKRPDVLILIDFPGFNLRLLDKVKSALPDTKVIYYISPQVWAWKAGRAYKMAKQIDLLLVIIPFEEKWFAEKTPSFNVKFVGHPILDRWDPVNSEKPLGELPRTIMLLPGSRRKEISAHLPLFLETVRKLSSYFSDYSFIILAASAESEKQLREIIARHNAENLNIQISGGYQLTHLSRARLALVASGTATLECALAGVPMLVVYRTSPITFFIGRRLVNLEHLSIVNLIAGRKIVPEFLQDKAKPDQLFAAAKALLESKEASTTMRKNLRAVVDQLGEPGANRTAVERIKEYLASQGM